MHKLDILFINPSSAQKAYQKLAETYSAIEPPTYHYYWQNHYPYLQS